MAYTEKDLQAVRKAIAGAQLEVQYGDKRVRFRSQDELLRADRIIRADLDVQAGRKRSRIVRVRHAGKGV